jgi:hypothetical protein
VFVALWAALAIFALTTIVPLFAMRFDFTPRYLGGQAFWRGDSPYSAEITAEIQHAIMGQVLPPNAARHQMFYPAYVAMTLAPLLLLPFDAAVSIWIGLQLTCVLITPALWIAMLGWKVRPLTLAALILGFGLLFRYPINLFVVGQFTGTVLLGLTGAYVLLQAQRDAAAGALLAVTAMPPQIAVPAALLLLGGYALIGRWRGLIAFGGVVGALVLITFAQIGWWIPDFMRQLREYTIYGDQTSALKLLDNNVVRAVWMTIIGAITLYLVHLFRKGRISPLDWFAAAILAPLLALVPTGNYYLVLLIPLLVIALWRADGRRHAPILWAGVALVLITPWVYRQFAPEVEMLAQPLLVTLLWFTALRGASLPLSPKSGEQGVKFGQPL